MRFNSLALMMYASLSESWAFISSNNRLTPTSTMSTSLFAIGVGPTKEEEEEITKAEKELIPGVDYEVPDHEAYRLSRRASFDEKCDAWFGALLGEIDDGHSFFLGDIAEKHHKKLMTPVELKNEFMKPIDDPEYTPFVSTRLPWAPLLPAFGLEQYGIPIPRRNAETWRHFDVTGMVNQDYSATNKDVGVELELNDEEVALYKEKLIAKGGWVEDDKVTARLVYINGQFCPQLSLATDNVRNMAKEDLKNKEVQQYLTRLTDGFTDELAAPVPDGKGELTQFSKLSKPNHCVGDPTSQFAINTQQGTACFSALNSIKTKAVALIRQPAGTDSDTEGDVKPILVVNALSRDIGATFESEGQGAAMHPRALLIAEENSRTSFVQSCVDLDDGEDRPTLYNGYTQIFVKEGAKLKHSYLEESGGMVTGGTELGKKDLSEGEILPREIESKRPALKDTHLEAIDVQLVGDEASYEGVLLSIGGSGRLRIAQNVAILRPGCHASVKGLSLTGGAQRTDIKTNLHHVAQGATSEQLQKNMIGGRGTGAWRGRIRVEQSAQQTESNQLSRTILLSDRCRAWAAPTLEIIADDVQCAHGATVSDLSEEELFYLQSRGLDKKTSRNMLMYAFAGDVTVCVDSSMRGEIDSKSGITKRVIDRLENLTPSKDRAVKGVFSSV
eukprot:CAMPEP_0194221596 /NCGR_PEP_ID=MMETSP0156-20130528/30932_1 /TAXON_ID=33649 /ORGANISM="Thalassionema nitzschioides, Strain L26-B" /LENGTH=671 /DNA_ID=CAMNT_0038952049 /DNA_START=54 /DNA_END=2069 /DNA_ORIENTATION=+